MKKFIFGLVLGLSVAFATTAFSSNSISTTLFPSQFVFNGQKKDLGSEYQVMNYNGHAYVPVRFIAENMGGSVGYDDKGSTPIISINYFPAGTTIYTDPQYYSNVHVGNIQVNSSGNQSVINGLVSIDPTSGTETNVKTNHILAFSLSFFNDKGEKIGQSLTSIPSISNGEIQSFQTKTNDDVKGYSKIQLYVEMLDSVRQK